MKQLLFLFLFFFNLICFSQDIKPKKYVNVLDGVYVNDYNHHMKMYYFEHNRNHFDGPDTNAFNGPYNPSKHLFISQSKWMKCLYYTHEKAYYFTFINDSSTFNFDVDYFWLTEAEFDIIYNLICEMIEQNQEEKQIRYLKHTYMALKCKDNRLTFYCFNLNRSVFSISMSFDLNEIQKIFNKQED